MALFDYEAEEVIAKVVYYGPPRAGKSTNLRHVHGKLASGNKSDLVMLTSEKAPAQTDASVPG